MAGIVSKNRMAPDGRAYGGKPFARGALYHMLQNRIYRGEIVGMSMRWPHLLYAIAILRCDPAFCAAS